LTFRPFDHKYDLISQVYLERLDLPAAPPVFRAAAAPLRQRKAPAVALLVLGALLFLGPIVGGLFSKVASGKQMIDEFAPHMEADALARYDADLAILGRGAAGIDAVYAQQRVAAGEFVGIDIYRQRSTDINERAAALLDRVGGAEPDYRKVDAIGGFDRVPFLIVIAGIVALYGGGLLLRGGASRSRSGAALVVVASVALVAYPFLSDLPNGTRAGERMLATLEPVMQPAAVRQLQNDFVAMVHAVGELDTSFRGVPQPGPSGADVATLVQSWPKVSSDLAALVGALNDNIDNFDAFDDLDGFTRSAGVSGLTAMPWLLVGTGALSAACAIAALARREKETTT